MHPRRLSLLLTSATIILLITGCVYARLYQFQRQLNEFESNFELNDNRGLTLIFKNPVLESGDIVWLMKNEPTSKKELEEGELWTYVFEKQYLVSDDEGDEYDIPIQMVMNGEMLTEITFPKRFLKDLSIPLLKKMFTSMGDADISKLSKSAKSKFAGDSKDEIPRMKNIIDTLGQPYYIEESDETSTFTYLYYLESGPTDEDREYFEFKTIFRFDKEDETLQKATGVIRGMSMSLDFTSE
jgi:hypothetical protein